MRKKQGIKKKNRDNRRSRKEENHFDNYPLLTQKTTDFNLFKQIIKLINDKEYLTLEGLQVLIKSYLNLGLSEEFKKKKKKFPNISTYY